MNRFEVRITLESETDLLDEPVQIREIVTRSEWKRLVIRRLPERQES